MLEIKFVRQNLALVREALKNRGGTADWESFTSADDQRKSILAEIEQLRHRRNVVSADVAQLKRKGGDAEPMMAEMRVVGERIKALEKELSEHEETLQTILMGIPNVPHASVPVGKDENDNPVLKSVGAPTAFAFEPKAHWPPRKSSASLIIVSSPSRIFYRAFHGTPRCKLWPNYVAGRGA